MHIGMKHPVPAVGAIILKDDKILLVKRGAEPGIGKWSIPGGSMEFGETMEEAVKREVKEETGLDVEVGKLAGVLDLIVKSDKGIQFHYVLIDYFATAVPGEPVAGTDAAECCWVPLSEIKNYDLTVSLEEMLKKHGLI
jgi:mutator protein MutT